jgi:hypothetical protein
VRTSTVWPAANGPSALPLGSARPTGDANLRFTAAIRGFETGGRGDHAAVAAVSAALWKLLVDVHWGPSFHSAQQATETAPGRSSGLFAR